MLVTGRVHDEGQGASYVSFDTAPSLAVRVHTPARRPCSIVPSSTPPSMRWRHGPWTSPCAYVAVSITDITSRKQAEQRLALLADAGEVLADTRDVPGIMRQVVRISLPTFADWCVVDLVRDDGAIERIASAHADPAKEPLVRALQGPEPTSWDADSPMVRPWPTARGRCSFEPSPRTSWSRTTWRCRSCARRWRRSARPTTRSCSISVRSASR